MKLLKTRLKYSHGHSHSRGTERETETETKTGEISVIPESVDDLWHLKHVIEPGDMVYSFTYRRIEEATDKVRPSKTEKKRLRLGLRVENIEFHKFSHRLRIKGVIEFGPDTEVGSYHTFNIEPNTELSIIKDWKKHQLKRLREAERASNSSPIIVLTIEAGEAVAGIVRQYGVDELFSIRYGTGKGMSEGDTAMKAFFGEVLRLLKQAYYNNDADAIIIAGPGFIKSDFYALLRDKAPELQKKTIIEQTTSIGLSGFIEVLKRGAVTRLREAERLASEVKLFERLMAEISREEGGKAVYGVEEVRKALQFGAIETLLVCDDELMAEGEGSRGIGIEEILKGVERTGGKIVVFSTEFEPGRRLKALGGIAALLRFKLYSCHSS